MDRAVAPNKQSAEASRTHVGESLSILHREHSHQAEGQAVNELAISQEFYFLVRSMLVNFFNDESVIGQGKAL